MYISGNSSHDIALPLFKSRLPPKCWKLPLGKDLFNKRCVRKMDIDSLPVLLPPKGVVSQLTCHPQKTFPVTKIGSFFFAGKYVRHVQHVEEVYCTQPTKLW